MAEQQNVHCLSLQREQGICCMFWHSFWQLRVCRVFHLVMTYRGSIWLFFCLVWKYPREAKWQHDFGSYSIITYLASTVFSAHPEFCMAVVRLIHLSTKIIWEKSLSKRMERRWQFDGSVDCRELVDQFGTMFWSTRMRVRQRMVSKHWRWVWPTFINVVPWEFLSRRHCIMPIWRQPGARFLRIT